MAKVGLLLRLSQLLQIRKPAASECRTAGAVLLLNDASAAITTGGRSNPDLRVTVVRVTPPPAFEESVRGGNPTEDDAIWQLAAGINYPASDLADI
jgi:hypothetical protein